MQYGVSGGELSADSGRFRARQAAYAAIGASAEDVGLLDRSATAFGDSQRAPAWQQIRAGQKSVFRYEIRRSRRCDDAACREGIKWLSSTHKSI